MTPVERIYGYSRATAAVAIWSTILTIGPAYLASFYNSALAVVVGVCCFVFWIRVSSSRKRELFRDVARARLERWLSLNVGLLQMGDVIATNATGKMSERIRRAINSEFSHVSIYIGENRVAEAVPPRSRIVAADTYFFAQNTRDIRILRPKKKIPKPKVLVAEAIFYSWGLYSLARASSYIWRPLARIAADDALICSEFIAKLYRRAGLPICEDDGRISPGDICRNEEFENVTADCVRPLSKLEAQECLEIIADQSNYSFIKGLAKWTKAIAFALSPIRGAWSRPASQWDEIHFHAMYARTLIWIGWKWLVYIPATLFANIVPVPADPKVKARLLDELRQQLRSARMQHLLLNRQRNLFDDYRAPWRVRFEQLAQIERQIRTRNLNLLRRLLGRFGATRL
jgi:hypothetical protein